MRSNHFLAFLFSLALLYPTLHAQQINPAAGELFRDDVIPRIDISIDPDSLDWIMDRANKDSDYHFHADFVFDNGTLRDTLQDIGFRLRGNTSRGARKKSFKVSFNTYVPGRFYQGVKKLNLNGQQNDPTISRAKLCADLARDLGLPSMRTNHVLLYINGDFYGVYLNVEHIDEAFIRSRFGNQDGNLYKCLYPADLDYKGADPALYRTAMWGRRVYDLKNNEHLDDYSDLAHFIDVLNNTPQADLACELEKVFDVDQYIRMMVFDILSGNWDGYIYNKNNFYLYQDQATGKISYIPYDLDNTFGIDWVGKDWGNRDIYAWQNWPEPRPLYTRLLADNDYRDRFSFLMNEAIAKHFNETTYNPYLDSLRTALLPWVRQDSFYSKDFGFSIADFQNAFDVALSNQHTDYGLKSYISTRKRTALAQLLTNDIAPIITEVSASHPPQDQPVIVTARLQDDGPIASVECCYHLTSQSSLQCLSMFDDGQHNDGLAGDGIYGASIPPLGQAGEVHYYIKASDSAMQESLFPPCGFNKAYVAELVPKLAINEFLASNDAVLADPSGQYDDWLEVLNYGTSPIFLGDKYLSDKDDNPDKWPLPDRVIQPGEFLLVWADDDEHQGDLHTNFKLSAGGEFIGIFNNAAAGFAQIDGYSFGAQTTDVSFGRIPDGTGSWQAMPPTPGSSNIAVSVDPEGFGNIAVSAAPNPFTETLRLHIQNPDARVLEVELVDITGRSYLELAVKQAALEQQFLLGALPVGMYFLSVKMNGRMVYSRKLVKR